MPQGRTIPADEWERHRKTVTDLYSKKPLKDVIAEMEKQHGFKASTYQFQTQLKIWGIRKSSKRDEWAGYFERIDNQEPTQITPAGREKPPNSFKRARRYLNATRDRPFAQPSAPSTALPDPVSLERQNETASHDSINPVLIDNGLLTAIDSPFHLEDTLANLEARLPSPNLPIATFQASRTSTQSRSVTSESWVPYQNGLGFGSPFDFDLGSAFENTFADIGPGIVSFSQAGLHDQVATGSSPTPSSTDYRLGGGIPSNVFDGNIQLTLNKPQGTLLNGQHHSSGGFGFWGDSSEFHVGLQIPSGNTELTVCAETSFASHFISFEQFLRAKGVHFTQLGPVGSRNWSSLSGGFSSKFISDVVLLKQQPAARSVSSLEKAIGMLETLIPSPGNTLVNRDQAFEIRFTRVLLFSMLNGFAGLNHIPVEDMQNFLGRFSILSRSFLAALRDYPTHAVRTFVDVIFRAAIEAKDKDSLKQLLEYGLVDVNAIICYAEERRFTPIERAAYLQAYSLVEILLQHGADVNKTSVQSGGGALKQLLLGLRFPRKDPYPITATIDMNETLDLLLKAGARATIGDLKRACEDFTGSDIACRISLAIPSSDHKAFFIIYRRGVPLLSVALHLDEIGAFRISRTMIDHCKTSCCGRCLVTRGSDIENAATEAAKRGHLKVVQLLMDYVASPTKVFCAAIGSNRKDLVDFVLSLSPDLNPPIQRLGNWKGEDFWNTRNMGLVNVQTTPLAEAVRVGNKELIQHLHSAGAFAGLNKGERLKPLILAAARRGNISLMRRLLSFCDNSYYPYQIPSLAVYIALQHDHEKVAWLLLESGARVKRHAGRISYAPLCLALQRQSKPLVQAILNADAGEIWGEDFEAAVKWHDLSIVDDLVAYGMDVHSLEMYARSDILFGWIRQRSSEPFRKLCNRCMRDDNTELFRRFVESLYSLDSVESREYLDAVDLLESRGRRDGHGLTLQDCLKDAVTMGHSEMVSYLLDIGINPFTNSVLEAALSGPKWMISLLFHKSRPRRTIPKCIGTRVLSSVMDESLDNPETLDALLGTQAVKLVAIEPLDDLVNEGFTPLGWALDSLLNTPDKDPWIVRALLDAGSDPNGVARTKIRGIGGGYTGLMVALETGRRDVVQLLIDSGANVNTRPRLAVRRTPLQYAAELGDLNMVRILLERGAELNAEPAMWGGGTALQFAAISGNCNIVNELLAKGALLDALPSRVQGRWPLEGAGEHGRLDMIQFLWTVAFAGDGNDVIAGFQRRHCLRAMEFARKNGHLGCRDLISDLSGIPVDRLDAENYGAPWLAYSDLSVFPSSGDGDMLFLSDDDGWSDYEGDAYEMDSDIFRDEAYYYWFVK